MNQRPVVAAVLTLALFGCGRDASPVADTASHTGHAAIRSQATQTSQMQPNVPGMADVDIPYERRQAIGVRTATVSKMPLSAKVRTVGVVAADERLVRKVQTKISGWVDRLFVNYTGQPVRAGEAILAIYSPELVATQREYLLALSASRPRNGSRSGIGEEEARLLIDSARNRLLLWDLTDEQIREIERRGSPSRTMVLHSPIAGYVTLKPVYQGMYVTPEMELYTVSDLGRVWIWADVYEDEIGFIRKGQAVTVALASEPGVKFPSTISYVSPTMETATRTVRVRLDVENAGGRLKPGMYATLELEQPLGEVVALPEDAVIDTGQRKVVFIQAGDSSYQPREVRLGRKAGGYYEVLGGVAPGERVAVSSQFLLDSESRLRAAAGGTPKHGSH